MSITLQLCLLCVLCVSCVISNQCSNDACCFQKANGNPSTGNGYLQFDQNCLSGGPNCVDDTGCELCFQYGFSSNQNIGNRPECNQCFTTTCCLEAGIFYNVVLDFNPICLYDPSTICFGFGCQFCVEIGQPNPNYLPSCSYCTTDECCALRANPNPSTGNGFQRFNQNCLQGGPNCVDSTGCELCYQSGPGHVNVGNRPNC